MDQSKKGFLPVLQGVKLSKTQSPTTTEDRKRMKIIPYASAIGSIKYVGIMLAIATFYEIWQMDVKTAFLNGYLKEELYMMHRRFCQS